MSDIVNVRYKVVMVILNDDGSVNKNKWIAQCFNPIEAIEIVKKKKPFNGYCRIEVLWSEL